MRNYGYDPARMSKLYRKHVAGPEPEASKPWHKIVVNIVTVLLVIGVLAWFILKIVM